MQCEYAQPAIRGATDCVSAADTGKPPFFAPSFASRNANADETITLSHRAETTLRDAFWCRPLQGNAPPYGRLGQSSRGTIGSRRFHPLRKAAYRSDGSMLLTMRAHS